MPQISIQLEQILERTVTGNTAHLAAEEMGQINRVDGPLNFEQVRKFARDRGLDFIILKAPGCVDITIPA